MLEILAPVGVLDLHRTVAPPPPVVCGSDPLSASSTLFYTISAEDRRDPCTWQIAMTCDVLVK